MDRRRLGAWGEKKAIAYLRGKGASILAVNFRCKAGEIDIIAREGSTVVFVEVKTRRDFVGGLPCESVGEGKQRRIARAAGAYLSAGCGDRRLAGADFRFDVIEVLLLGGRAWLRHVKGAFWGE
ncbi:MAG: YraN family protein [Clostridiales Family XIII bacterium]|jgi:putative endonuclease|nr:YraN family protein [Clostridiales Family XIII bacterium]